MGLAVAILNDLRTMPNWDAPRKLIEHSRQYAHNFTWYLYSGSLDQIKKEA